MTWEIDRSGLGFDLEALRTRYRRERDKRMRGDGAAQYVEPARAFSRFVDDPFAPAAPERPALTDDVEVLIVGGGFGGLLTGARLREAGVDGIRVVEKAADFGGTWYWNRYPGAACDVESYIYLPLLEELGYIPTERYASAPEIFEYCRAIGRRYDLYRDARFQTSVVGLAWDDDASRWIVDTDRGDRMLARFVVLSIGPFSRPRLPGIPGIDRFRGRSFHTSRWDYGYTGGDVTGSMDRLADQRVGVIGTGATAVQIIPPLADAARELFVFQRTPSSIAPRDNRPTDPSWAASLEPGWQKRRIENFNLLVSGGLATEDLVQDTWTDVFRLLTRLVDAETLATMSGDEIEAAREIADFLKMEQIRDRIERTVEDPVTAEALKPYYRIFCKRPCIHDDYLPTFNRPHVHLVDTDGRGVDEITENGVVVGDREYPLDCIIFATGFEFGTTYTQRAGYEIRGRGGRTLSSTWKDGARTLHGMYTHGFPNLAFLGQIQATMTPNMPHAMDVQASHLAHVIAHALDTGSQTMEATPEAQDAWVSEILNLGTKDLAFREECTPGNYNDEGRPDLRTVQNGAYGGGSIRYFDLLREWRDEGDFSGLRLTP
jgi:cyclohexanone monooxygenase